MLTLSMLTYIYSQVMDADATVYVILILMPVPGTVLKKLACLNPKPLKCQIKVRAPVMKQAYVVLMNQAYNTT
jgi:hypothetical protein